MRCIFLLPAAFVLAFSTAALGQTDTGLAIPGSPASPADGTATPDPTDGTAAATAAAAGTPSLSLDDTITGAIPRENPRVTPEPPVPAVTPERRRPPEDDPFAPIGIRVGSFILYPAVTTGLGYTTNATAAAGGRGSGFVDIAPEVLLKSDWLRHEATLSLRGSFKKFLDGSTEEEPTGEAIATARIDLPTPWTVDLKGAWNYDRESFSDPSFPAGATAAPGVNAFTGSMKLKGKIGSVDLTLEGNVDRTLYSDAYVGAVVVDQSDRDTMLYGGRVRLGYEIGPALTPFVELEATRRIYDLVLDHNGIDRASRGVAARVGVAFDSGPVLSGDIAIGARRETFDDPAFQPLSAFTVDGSLVWSPTPLVTVTTDIATVVEPSTDPASAGSIAYNGSVDVAYAYRPNITVNAIARLDHQAFADIGGIDRTYHAGAALTWKLNRTLSLTGTYDHEWLVASDPAANYTADSIRVDLRAQR